MGGAYTSKPDAVPTVDVPDGWNPEWPHPGPWPPGYTPVLSMSSSGRTSMDYNGSAAVTFTLKDKVTYQTHDPGTTMTISATLDGAAVGLRKSGGSTYASSVSYDYAELASEFYGALTDLEFELTGDDRDKTLRIYSTSTTWGYSVSDTHDITVEVQNLVFPQMLLTTEDNEIQSRSGGDLWAIRATTTAGVKVTDVDDFDIPMELWYNGNKVSETVANVTWDEDSSRYELTGGTDGIGAWDCGVVSPTDNRKDFTVKVGEFTVGGNEPVFYWEEDITVYWPYQLSGTFTGTGSVQSTGSYPVGQGDVNIYLKWRAPDDSVKTMAYGNISSFVQYNGSPSSGSTAWAYDNDEEDSVTMSDDGTDPIVMTLTNQDFPEVDYIGGSKVWFEIALSLADIVAFPNDCAITGTWTYDLYLDGVAAVDGSYQKSYDHTGGDQSDTGVLVEFDSEYGTFTEYTPL